MMRHAGRHPTDHDHLPHVPHRPARNMPPAPYCRFATLQHQPTARRLDVARPFLTTHSKAAKQAIRGCFWWPGAWDVGRVAASAAGAQGSVCRSLGCACVRLRHGLAGRDATIVLLLPLAARPIAASLPELDVPRQRRRQGEPRRAGDWSLQLLPTLFVIQIPQGGGAGLNQPLDHTGLLVPLPPPRVILCAVCEGRRRLVAAVAAHAVGPSPRLYFIEVPQGGGECLNQPLDHTSLP
jgi:hypothetical protein